MVPMNRLRFLCLILLLATCYGSAQNNPVPFINQPLVPASIAPRGSDFTLTVNGTGFVSGSVVNWNGSPKTTSLINASQLVASISASDVAQPGTAIVTVSNPSPGGGTSNPAFMQVTISTSALQFSRTDYVAGEQPQ